MIRVHAPSRLHFGLFGMTPPGADSARYWPNRQGEPVLTARYFGGAGLMVQRPGLRLTVSPAPGWYARGPLAERALAYARHFLQTLPLHALPPQQIIVEAAAPEHVGLGTGTQLGLAVAHVLAVAAGLPDLGATELARRVGRGARSALGVHGFGAGGFLVDGGKREADALASLVARAAFPEDWRVVLALPSSGPGLHGVSERQAFERLAVAPTDPAHISALCRLVLLGMLPALAERDVEAFGEALYDFNVRVGEAFAPVQGGTYAGPQIAELVAFLRRASIRGVGQSSWGPAVFAVVADEDRATDLAAALRMRFALDKSQVVITGGDNQGAVCTVSS
jgi:beta-RFAP synthase